MLSITTEVAFRLFTVENNSMATFNPFSTTTAAAGYFCFVVLFSSVLAVRPGHLKPSSNGCCRYGETLDAPFFFSSNILPMKYTKRPMMNFQINNHLISTPTNIIILLHIFYYLEANIFGNLVFIGITHHISSCLRGKKGGAGGQAGAFAPHCFSVRPHFTCHVLALFLPAPWRFSKVLYPLFFLCWKCLF